MNNYSELINKLEQAEKLLSEFRGGYSDNFLSAEEFNQAFVKELYLLKSGDSSVLDHFRIWFMPSYDWDDFTRGDGLELGNEIFVLLTNSSK